jgi:ABC-2 type transport system permease protein
MPPLTYFIRIAQSVLLKGSTLGDLQTDTMWLVALMFVAMTIAVTRFRRTLD